MDSATSLIQVTTISVEVEILSSPHSGSEELDERSGVDGEGVLCSKHQVQEAGDKGADVVATSTNGNWHCCHHIFPIDIAAFIHYHAFEVNNKYRKLEN